MHIIEELEGLIGWVVKQILLIAGVLIAVTIAPVVLIVLPQVLLITNPKSDFQTLGLIFIWTTPAAVSLWMAFLCHIHSIRLSVLRGQSPSEWASSRGGWLRVNLRSTGFMFLGLFSSFACEMLLLAAFSFLPYSTFSGAARLSLWFALFPLAAFAPALLLLYKRRNYDEPLRLKADDPEWLAYLEKRRVQAGDDKFLKSLGVS